MLIITALQLYALSNQSEKALILAGIKFAQSDNISAAAVLTKCLDIEYGQTNGFKAPILGELGEGGDHGNADQSTADTANPWSKWSNSNINTSSGGGGTSTVGKPGTPTASGVRTPKANIKLIQPVKTYLDDVNNEVMIAMVSKLYCYVTKCVQIYIYIKLI